ncbi:MAG TPA: DUF2244 domain-containing protein [Paracoccaceae bacterium]|nr:DUF2244 domain-containing protein [Paracoccaceae bacterium]
MIRERNDAAGGVPPAARISGPRWRERHDRPVYQATIWPNQSLSYRGYQLALAAAGIGLALPLLGLLGTGIFWMIAVFVVVPFLALRLAFRQNARALRIEERLQIWRDEVRVERREADGRILRWQCDPMRLRLHLHKNGKVEDYLTLAGGGREIELGAFLAPEERIALAEEIENGLNRALRH